MNDADIEAFDQFLERNWGIKPPKLAVYDEEGREIKGEGADEQRQTRRVPVATTQRPVREGMPRRTSRTSSERPTQRPATQRPPVRKRPVSSTNATNTAVRRRPPVLKDFDLDEE